MKFLFSSSIGYGSYGGYGVSKVVSPVSSVVSHGYGGYAAPAYGSLSFQICEINWILFEKNWTHSVWFPSLFIALKFENIMIQQLFN